MFAFTSKIFAILIDVICSAFLVGLGLIVLAIILYTVICVIRAMVKHEKNEADD